jgi:hypothetical protein
MDKENKYKKLFGYINLIEPPRGLGARIVNAINAEERRLARFKVWAFGGASLASFGFSLWAIVYLLKSAQQSGFLQYLSLIFSDITALAYSREIALSLTESLPIAGLILSLLAIGFFIWSVTKISPPAPSYFKRGFQKVSA